MRARVRDCLRAQQSCIDPLTGAGSDSELQTLSLLRKEAEVIEETRIGGAVPHTANWAESADDPVQGGDI